MRDDGPAEDARVFGENTWVYCDQHLAPHQTGWCGVDPRNKTRLDATHYVDAAAECRAKGYTLYADLVAVERGQRD